MFVDVWALEWIQVNKTMKFVADRTEPIPYDYIFPLTKGRIRDKQYPVPNNVNGYADLLFPETIRLKRGDQKAKC